MLRRNFITQIISSLCAIPLFNFKQEDKEDITFVKFGDEKHGIVNGEIVYILYKNGTKETYKDGQLHSYNDKPALINQLGHKFWFKNGKLHREDGPAIEDYDGDKFWYINGKLHRIDRPAVEHANGHKVWYENGLYKTDNLVIS